MSPRARIRSAFFWKPRRSWRTRLVPPTSIASYVFCAIDTTEGSITPFLTASWTDAGVPRGAMIASKVPRVTSKPHSLNVGTSRANGKRRSSHTRSATALPALTSGTICPGPPTAASTCPSRTAVYFPAATSCRSACNGLSASSFPDVPVRGPPNPMKSQRSAVSAVSGANQPAPRTNPAQTRPATRECTRSTASPR